MDENNVMPIINASLTKGRILSFIAIIFSIISVIILGMTDTPYSGYSIIAISIISFFNCAIFVWLFAVSSKYLRAMKVPGTKNIFVCIILISIIVTLFPHISSLIYSWVGFSDDNDNLGSIRVVGYGLHAAWFLLNAVIWVIYIIYSIILVRYKNDFVGGMKLVGYCFLLFTIGNILLYLSSRFSFFQSIGIDDFNDQISIIIIFINLIYLPLYFSIFLLFAKAKNYNETAEAINGNLK